MQEFEGRKGARGRQEAEHNLRKCHRGEEAPRAEQPGWRTANAPTWSAKITVHSEHMTQCGLTIPCDELKTMLSVSSPGLDQIFERARQAYFGSNMSKTTRVRSAKRFTTDA